MSNITPDDLNLKLDTVHEKLNEEDLRLWEGLEDEKISRIAGDEANKKLAQQVQKENQGTEARLSTEVIHRSEGDLVNVSSLNALAQALSDYRIKTDLELSYERIAREQLGVDLTVRMDTEVASFGHRESLLYSTIDAVQRDVDNKYTSMDSRISKYEDMLQDITTDSIQITTDNGEINMGAWTILSQAREWDLEIIANLKGFQDKTTEDINKALDEVQSKLPVEQDIIAKAIEQLSNASIIKELDDKLASNLDDINNVQQGLIKEVQNRQEQMVGLAQDQANELKKYSEDLVGKITTESQERIDGLQREALVRQQQLLLEAEERSTEINEKLASVENNFSVDLTALNNRIDATDLTINELNKNLDRDVAAINERINDANTKADDISTALEAQLVELNSSVDTLNNKADAISAKADAIKVESDAISAKADAIKVESDQKILALNAKADGIHDEVSAETTARTAAVSALNDGLTSEIQHRKDGDQVITSAIENYKSSNDTALANVRTELTANVTATTTNATKIDALDVRLTTNEGETGEAKALAASATQKADTALTETSALASQMITVKASIEGIEDALVSKVDASAFNQLKAEVVEVDGKVLTNTQDLTALKTTVTGLDGKVTGNTSAISELTTQQVVQGNQITQLTSDTTALKNSLEEVEDDLATKVDSTAFNELSTKVDKNAGDIAVQAGSITKLQSDLALTNQAVNTKANSTALTALDTKVTNINGKVTSNTSAITDLASRVTVTEDDISKKADASALSSLDTKVTSIDGKVSTHGSSITKLQNDLTATNQKVATKADATALSALSNSVTEQSGKITSNSTAITDLTNKVNIVEDDVAKKADATALNALEARVTTNEGIIVSQGSAITSLDNRVDTVEDGLATKAEAAALSTLDTKVTKQGTDIATNSTAITKLTNDLVTTNNKVNTKADASALNTLDTKVTSIDGKVTSQGTQITSLTNRVTKTEEAMSKKADSSALTSLSNTVTQHGTDIAAQGTSITNLSGRVTTNEQNISKKADASAVSALDTKVTQQGSTITSHGNSITKLTNDLATTNNKVALKADASALTTLDNKVTQQGKDITANSTAITVLTGRVTTAENNINKKLDASVIDAYSTTVQTDKAIADRITAYDASLIIGGANLLRNTALKGSGSFPDYWFKGIAATITGKADIKAVDGTFEYTVTNPTALADISAKQNIPVNTLDAGDTLTASMYIKEAPSDGSLRVAVTFYVTYTDGTTVPSSLISAAPTKAGMLSGTKKVVLATDKTVASMLIWYSVYPKVVGITAKLVAEHYQLEYGNKATAWNPSYEDADKAINTNATAIQSINTAVTSLDGRVTSNSSAITNLNNKVNVIEQDVSKKADTSAVNSLTTRVENAEGKLTSQGTSITSLNSNLATTNTNVTAAQNAANAANTLAGGKGKVLYQSTTPATADRLSQNLWIDTTGNANTPKRWNGSAWVAVTDKVATDAAAAAANALNVANTKTDATAFNALDTKVTSIDNTVTSQGTAITKLTNDLATTNANVDTKASTTALSSLDSKVNTVDGKVTTNADAITSLKGRVTTTENGLATKADASALSNYYTKTQSDAKATEIAAGEVSKYDASLVIGGKNTFSSTTPITVLTNVNLTTREHSIVGNLLRFSTASASSRMFRLANTITEKGFWTVSGWVKGNQGTNKPDFKIDICDQAYSPVFTASGSTDWEYFSYTGEVTRDITSVYNFVDFNLNSYLNYEFKDVKVEKGKKATDWSPSPSDIKSGIDANSTAITNTNTEITKVDGRVTANSNSITNLNSRMSTAEGNISKKADATALNNYYTKSQADSAVAGQVSNLKALMTSRGQNLLLDGSFEAYTTTIGPLTLYTNNTRSGSKCVKFTRTQGTSNGNNNDATPEGWFASQPSRVYYIEYWVKKDPDTVVPEPDTSAYFNIGLQFQKVADTLSFSWLGVSGKFNELTDTWTKYSGYVTAPDNAYQARLWMSIPSKEYNVQGISVLIDDIYVVDATEGSKARSETSNLATAVNALDTKVTKVDDRVTTESNRITTLTGRVDNVVGDLATKADTSALQSLDSKVTQQGKDITSQGASITKITNDLATTNQALETKASVNALNALDTKVSTVDNKVTSQGTQIAEIKTTLDGVKLNLGSKADASALSALDAKVTKQGTDITTQGSSITKLQSDLAQTNTNVSKKADTTALNSLDTKVTSIDGRVTTNTNSITSLSGRVTTVEGDLTKKADATALNSYYTKTQSDSALAGQATAFDAKLRTLPSQGENLVPNGTFDPNLPSYGFTGIPSDSEGVPAGCPFPYVTRLANRDHFLDTSKTTNIPCKAGDVYEVSVLVACAAGTANFNLYTYRRNSATTPTNLLPIRIGSVTAAEGATWKRLTVRWTVPAHATHQFFVPFLQIEQNSPWGTVWYATDWSCVNVSAGAKAQTVADATATALTNTNTEVSRINGVATAASNATTTLAGRIATVESAVATKAEASALNDYYTKTQADTAIAGQISTFSSSLKVGGTNLFALSKASEGFYLTNNGVLVSSGSDHANITGDEFIAVGQNTKITFQLWNDNGIINTANSNYTCFYASDKSTLVGSVLMQKITGATYQVQKISIPAGAVYVRFGALCAINRGAVKDPGIRLKFEFGDVPTDWSVAEADVQSQLDANATANTNTNTEVTRINGVVVSQGTSITNLNNSVTTLQGQMSNKADSSALSALDSKVTQQGKDITSQGASITKLNNSVNVIGLQGSNLIPDGSFEVLDRSGPRAQLYTADAYKGSKSLRFFAGSGYGEVQLNTFRPTGLRKYKLSFRSKIIVSPSTSQDVILQFAYSTNSNETLTVFSGARRYFATNAAVDTEWVLTEGVFTIPENATYVMVRFVASPNTTKGEFLVDDASMIDVTETDALSTVVATKADTTALSTLDSKVTAIDGRVTANTSSITNLSSRISTAEGNINKKADASALNSYYTKTETDTVATNIAAGKVNDFKASMTFSVGEQLIVNPNFETGDFMGWKIAPNTGVTYSVVEVNDSANIAKVVYSTGYAMRITQLIANNAKPFLAKAGRTYQLSCLVKSTDVIGAGSGQHKLRIAKYTAPSDAGSVLKDVAFTAGTTADFVEYKVEYTPSTDTLMLASAMLGYVSGTVEFKSFSFLDVTDRLGLESNAQALQTTNAEVTRINGVVVAQGTQLTNLTARVDGKADSSAVSSLQTTVTQQGKDIKTNSDATTALTNRVTTAEGAIVSNTNALSTLTTKVNDVDGRVTSQATSITKLTAESNSKASYIISTHRNSSHTTGSLARGLYNSQKVRLFNFARGLNLIVWGADGTPSTVTQYDTYASAAAVTSLIEALNALSTHTYFTIVGNDHLNTYPAASADLKAVITANGGSAEYVAKWKGNTIPIFTSKKGQAPNTGIQHLFDSTVTNDAIAYVLDLVGGIPVGLAGAPSIDTSQFATATALSSLDAKVTTIDGKTTSNANSLTQLQTTVDGHTSSIAVNASSINGIKSEYTIKLDVNGLVSGIGLINDGKSSAVGINADYFYIGKPTAGKKPFMVLSSTQTIGGVTYPAGTWIDVALIANATIGTAHIADASITNAKIASLDASKITAGFINADRIQAGSIDATKMRILDNTNLWVNRYLDYTPATIEGASIASGGISGNRAVMASRDHVGSLNTRYALRAGDTIVTEFSARQDKGTATPLNAGVWCTNTANMMTQILYPAASEVADLGNGWKRYRTVVKVTEAATEYGKLFFQIEQNASGGSLGYSVSDITQRRASGGELIVDGAITANKLQVDELSAISANLGTLVTYKDPSQPTKARMVLTGSLITVYDDNNIVRVKMGLW